MVPITLHKPISAARIRVKKDIITKMIGPRSISCWALVGLNRQSVLLELRMLDPPIDDYWSCKSVCILATVMRVIPASTVQPSLEGIGERATRSNRALLDGWHAIKPRCLVLYKTMPVERCSFCRPSNIVRHSDLNSVTPICFDCWTWYLAIYHDNAPVDTIWSLEVACNDEGVGANNSSRWGLLIRI